jgi:glutamate-1-semialdehyde 2,1-aminomutase
VAPVGDIYQAGTLSGNPLAMAAGLATLKILKKGDIYTELEKKGAKLFYGLENVFKDAGVEVSVNRIGSMGSLFFTPGPVVDFSTAKAIDESLFKRYYSRMLEQGIYLAPSPYEASFLSTAHSESAIQRTIDCATKALKSL